MKRKLNYFAWMVIITFILAIVSLSVLALADDSRDPTPSDTPTPTPVDTATPTPEPTFTPTPEPTFTPTPEPTFTPTPEPTFTPTPEPTFTPTPNPSDTPTATPTPTITATPTPAPTQTSTPRPGNPWPAVGKQYIRIADDIYPIIQMNMSWKRSYRFEPITFDAGNSYDPDGYISVYEWDFGDGSAGEGATVQHAYRDAGKYTVKITVIDNGGADRSAYLTAIVSSRPPVAVPGNDTNATVGTVVGFNGSASHAPGGRIVKYEWSFGDGNFGQGVSVSHAYERPDKYKVELRVTDDSGGNATAFTSVYVSGLAATPTPAASSGSPQGIALLAGIGIAIVAVMVLARKKAK